MRVDLPSPNGWLKLCDAYRAGLPFQDPLVHVQLYFGYQHALWEVTQELAKIFAHKKTIAVAAGVEPAFDDVAAAFSAEGYTVRYLTPAELADPAKWFDEIQKDLLFVLNSEDDLVTGRLFDLSPLESLLKDKRVFRVAVSHAAFHLRPEQRPGLYEIRILSLSSERALMTAGERARVAPSVAPKLPWRSDDAAQIAHRLSVFNPSELAKHQAEIVAFEAKLPTGFQAYFAKDEPRVFDRAVIFSPEFDGSAIIEELARALGTGIAKPGVDEPFDTTSPCRWQSPKFAEWLTRRGFSEEQVRGLIVIAAHEVGVSLSDKLKSASEKIRAIQNGV